MKKVIAYIVLFNLCHQLAWPQCVQPLNSGVTTDLHAVYFTQPDRGWVTGENGMLRFTTDSGANWTTQDARTGQTINGLFFIDDNTGWAVGNKGIIRQTSFGGGIWLMQYSPVRSDLYDVFFASATNGLAVGACGTILRTTDSGTTWAIVPSGTDNDLYRVRFVNPSTALASGAGGTLLRSANGGITWAPVGGVGSGNLEALAANGTAAWLGSAGSSYRSTNGGTNWTALSLNTTSFGAAAPSADQAYFVGTGGSIWETDNGGISFNNLSLPAITDDLLDVMFPNGSVGYAVGKNGRLVKITYFQVGATVPGPVCNGWGEIDLNGEYAGTGATYSWTNPQGVVVGNQLDLSLPNADPSMAGIYTLAVTLGGCTHTDTALAVVNVVTAALVPGYDSVLCEGQQTTVTATGGVYYDWSNNTAGSSTTIQSDGNYTVTVTDAIGCTDTENFTIGGIPVLMINNIQVDCDATATNYTVTFTISGGLGGYSVSPAIGGSLAFDTFTSNPIPSGSGYSFTVTDASDCSPVSVAEAQVNCNCFSAVGTMNLTPITVCGSQVATAIYDDTGEFFDANDARVFYLHEGSGSALVNPISFSSFTNFSFQPSMSYGVTYYISAVVGSDDGSGGVDLTDPCLAVAPGTPVTFYPIPTLTISGPGKVCKEDPLVLSASSNATNPTYYWLPGGTSADTPTFYLNTDEMFSVTVTDGNGCTQTATKMVEAINRPDVTFAGDDPFTICQGDTLTLEAEGGPSYEWSNGSNNKSIVIVLQTTTTYFVTITDDPLCPGTAQTTVTVRVPPVADAGADLTTCTGEVLLQTTLPQGALPQWLALTGGFLADPDAASTAVEDLLPGENLFLLKVTAPPCPGEALDTVTVSYIDASIAPEDDEWHTTIGEAFEGNVLDNDGLPAGIAYSLQLLQSDDNGEWQLLPDGSLSFEPESGFHGPALARYRACLSDCDTVCAEAVVRISVLRPQDDIGETQLVTPNGDGANEDLVFDYLNEYPDNSITIFNRWGDVVFRAKPYLEDWVRNHSGGTLPTGTYYYILSLYGDDNAIWGNVLLMR